MKHQGNISKRLFAVAKRGCLGCAAVLLAFCLIVMLIFAALWWSVGWSDARRTNGGQTVTANFYFGKLAGKPTLRGWVNGVPGDFLIDSGMEAALALQSRFAEFCNVPVTGTVKVLAHQQIEECMLGRVDHFAIGTRDRALHLEHDRRSAQIGALDYLPDLEGILGAGMFERHRARIDFSAGRIMFFHHDGQATPEHAVVPEQGWSPLHTGRISAPLKMGFAGLITVEVSMGDARGRFLVDSGAGKSSLSPEFRCRSGLPTGRMASSLLNDRPTATEILDIPGLSLASNALPVGPVSMAVLALTDWNNNVRKRGGEEIDGILGADFLAAYGACLDYGSLTMTLSAAPRAPWKVLWDNAKWTYFKVTGQRLINQAGFQRMLDHEIEGTALELVAIEPSPTCVLSRGGTVKFRIRYACPNLPNPLIDLTGTCEGTHLVSKLIPVPPEGGEVELGFSLKDRERLDTIAISLRKILHQTTQSNSTSYVTEVIVEQSHPVRLEWRAMPR